MLSNSCHYIVLTIGDDHHVGNAPAHHDRAEPYDSDNPISSYGEDAGNIDRESKDGRLERIDPLEAIEAAKSESVDYRTSPFSMDRHVVAARPFPLLALIGPAAHCGAGNHRLRR